MENTKNIYVTKFNEKNQEIINLKIEIENKNEQISDYNLQIKNFEKKCSE